MTILNYDELKKTVGFVQSDKLMRHLLTPDGADLFGQLMASQSSFARKNMLVEIEGKKYFYLSATAIHEETAFSEKVQMRLVKKLEDAGVIETAVMYYNRSKRKFFRIADGFMSALAALATELMDKLPGRIKKVAANLIASLAGNKQEQAAPAPDAAESTPPNGGYENEQPTQREVCTPPNGRDAHPPMGGMHTAERGLSLKEKRKETRKENIKESEEIFIKWEEGNSREKEIEQEKAAELNARRAAMYKWMNNQKPNTAAGSVATFDSQQKFVGFKKREERVS